MVWITLSYLFVILAGLAAVARSVKEDDGLLLPMLMGCGGLLVVVIAYMLPVRIGFVMFVNGLCVMSLLKDVWLLLPWSKVEVVDGSTDADTDE